MMKVVLFFSIMMVVIGSTAFSFVEKPFSGSSCTVDKDINLDFVLVNKTGYDIENVYVAPSKQREWGDDIMGKELLEDGDSVEITFDGSEKTKKWDIYVTWLGYEADEDRYWTGFDLSKINEITLFYDGISGKTWAEWK